MAKISRGSITTYEVACVAWFDLLGYGSMLEAVSFDPTALNAHVALKRLNDFHELAARHSGKRFHIQAINDGIIVFKDLSARTNSVTFDFLAKLIKLFYEFNSQDTSYGYPGARMVISAGFRVRIPRQTVGDEVTKLSNLFDRVRDGRISVDQAVNDAFHARPYFGYLPELQANFAFTKSYLVDSLGSQGGFGGPNCFIDMSLFDRHEIDWIKFSTYVNWQDKGMSSIYGRLESFDRAAASKNMYPEVLDAFGIAEKISKQDNVTNILRASKIRKQR